MPIETPHPLYSANLERWQRCRDAYEGEDTIKTAGDKYLPKVDPSQTAEEYEAYKRRALYYEAVSRTVDGFVGAISRKPHVLDLPGKLAVMLQDATTDGTGLSEFVKKLSGEALLLGRGGVLVDYDEALARTYFAFYAAESIINWSASSVVLMETVYEADPSDPFAKVEIQQIRQARIEDGRYLVTIWRKNAAAGAEKTWTVYQEILPTNRGVPIKELPWFWLSPIGRTSNVAKPPLLGLVNVSMSHYRSSADLEHGRHFTAMPTLYVTGISNSEPIRVGGGAAIIISDPEGKVGYAEFTGQGLKSLETAIEDKEQQMAVLGAAVFAGGKKGVEAAETARIRTSGENSLLMGVVSSAEETLRAAVACAGAWMGEKGEATINLNRDFIDEKLDPQTLVGMVQAYQAGAMSIEAFLYCLDQGGMLPPETDLSSEAAKLMAAKAVADKVLADARKPPAAVPPANPGGDK